MVALEQVQLDELRLEKYIGFTEIVGAPVAQPRILGVEVAQEQEQPTPPLPSWLRGELPTSWIGGEAAACLSKEF